MSKTTGKGTNGTTWELLWVGDRLLTEIEREAYNRVEMGCNILRNEMMRSMKPGTGRIYKKLRGGKAGGTRGRRTDKNYIFHRASAPGQPPAPDTGQLRRSISYEIYMRKHLILGKVGSGIPYAKYLEFGTRKMKPRPFARPALDKHYNKIMRIIGTGYK